MLGLSEEKPKVKKTDNKADEKSTTSQSDEAKEMLAKMKAKNDAGDCAFC